jgi:hypothetical protein
MLPLVAAVLLAVTPTSPSPSLLTPDAGRHLSARLLVAQAPPDAPPEAPTPAPRVDPELDARINELSQQVALLQSEIRSINVNFPTGSLVMTYFGYVLSPLLLLGLPLVIYGFGAADAGDRAGFLNVGGGLTVAGLVGVGLFVAGLINGSRESNANRARREELVRERIRLEDDLRDLKARRDARSALQARRWQPRPTLPVVALSF